MSSIKTPFKKIFLYQFLRKIFFAILGIFSYFFINLNIANADNLSDQTQVNAEQNLYFVENISTKATAKNPNGARVAAINNARRDAFLILLSRLKMSISTADNISDDEISDMVRSEQIIDEKIAGNSYKATLNISFAKDFVEHILGKKNQNKVDEKPSEAQKIIDKSLIIAIKKLDKRPIIWDKNNDWRIILERMIIKKNLQRNFVTPEPSLENVMAVNDQNINDMAYAGLEKLANDYQANAAFLLFFNHDEIENKVLVEVVYLKKSQKKQFRLSFINVDRLSYNELILKVAEKVLDYLNKNPIASKLDDKDGAEQNGGDIFTLTVKIKNFEDWRNLKTTLENSNLVDEIIIESFAKDQVIFDIKYNSKITLEEALSSLGVKYAKSGDKSYEIQLNNNAN